MRGSFAPISSQYSDELTELVNSCLNKDYKKRPNVTDILNLPGIKAKALALNIAIPLGSVLSDSYTPRDVKTNLQPRMGIIEEEKIPNLQHERQERPLTGVHRDAQRPSKIPIIKKIIKKDVVLAKEQPMLMRPQSGILAKAQPELIQNKTLNIISSKPSQVKNEILPKGILVKNTPSSAPQKIQKDPVKEIDRKIFKQITPHFNNNLKPKLLLQPKSRLLRAVSSKF